MCYTQLVICTTGRSKTNLPQHWYQSQKRHKTPNRHSKTTTHDTCRLKWEQQKYKRTVKLSKLNNVATSRLAPGFIKFKAYEETSGFNNTKNVDSITAKESHIIENDEDEEIPFCKPINP